MKVLKPARGMILAAALSLPACRHLASSDPAFPYLPRPEVSAAAGPPATAVELAAPRRMGAAEKAAKPAQRHATLKPDQVLLAAGKDEDRSAANLQRASADDSPSTLQLLNNTTASSDSEPLAPPPAPDNGTAGEFDRSTDELSDLPALSLADLEQMALESNPTIAQLASVVQKAQGVRRQVGLYPNPTVSYLGEEMGDDGTLGQQGGFVSQTIVTGDKLRLNRVVADQNINQLLWELEAQRFRVRNGVGIQFYETLGAQRRLELTQELVELAEQGLDATRKLLEAKRVAELDVLQAEIQLNEIRILAANAEAGYEAAWRQLAALVGRPEVEPTRLAGTLEDSTAERDFEDLWRELRATSPELQAAQARINRAFAQIQREQVQPIPNVLSQVSVTHNNASGDELVGVQLGLPLPIFNRNQGNIDTATAEYYRAVHESRRLELALRNRLADAFQQYQQARRQVEIYQSEILPKAQQTLDLTSRGYDLGRLDLLRVLTARQTYFQSSLAAVRSRVALRQAEVVLSGLLLTGGLNDVPDIASDVGGLGNRDQALSGQ